MCVKPDVGPATPEQPRSLTSGAKVQVGECGGTGTGQPRSVAAGQPEPVAAGQPEPVAAGQPEPVALGQPEPVAAGQPEPVAVAPRSTMRLWLLCGFAAAMALVAVAGANRGDSKKDVQGREGTGVGGRRRPHRPCSGCFSVLSEESQVTSWRASEDEDVRPGRRERAAREYKEPAQPARHGGSVRPARQEVPSVPRRGAVPAARRSPTAGERRGPSHRQATP
ncbi:germ cell nuclear acidic protein-like [Caloenas nicobarica]|uniref:germ cell nuclear acidic protein-like n=1 Tax=Caloenas nicobarica TaxID=187106 RepID=UPI0032B7521D